MTTEKTTEKWSVIVPISDHMKRMFSEDEMETFAKVLAIYTLPDGDPDDDVNFTRTTNMITGEEMLLAYVRVHEVMDTSATFDTGKLYDGATMTPDELTPPDPTRPPASPHPAP